MKNKINLKLLTLRMDQVFFISSVMVMIIMPLHVNYLPPLIILLSLLVIKRIFLIQTYQGCKILEPSYLLLILFLVFYFWQCISLLYTENLNLGFLNLFSRLALIAFPLIFISPPNFIVNKVWNLIKIFAISTFTYILTCFVYAAFRSFTIINNTITFNPIPPDYPWLNYFYSSYLTIDQHPSYIAMYALLSAFISFESCFSVSRKSSKVLWLCIGIILTLSQYFISSRVGILTSLVLIPAYFVYKIIKTGKYRLLIFVPLIFISTLPVILKNQRVDYLFGRVFNKQVGYIRKKDPRFLIWKSAMNVSKNNLMFGVGIGDVRTELFKEYEKTEEPYIIKEKYNAHNQFLETLVEDGIIGLMIFLVLIILMFYISYKERNLLYGIFIIISLAFFIFESVLYRFAGISFFSLFSFLLLHIKKKQCS